MLTASDSSGFVYDPEGIDTDKLAWLKDLKTNRRGRISEYADEFGIVHAPSRAANAGGVAVSGLEMTQNSMRLSWSQEELIQRLLDIHQKCRRYGQDGEEINYVKGANIAGFVKVADAMLAYGVL